MSTSAPGEGTPLVVVEGVGRTGGGSSQRPDTFLLDFDQLIKSEALMRFLAESNVFFAKKVGVSSYLARRLGTFLRENGYVRSFEQCSLSDLKDVESIQRQISPPFVLLVDLLTLEKDADEIIQVAFHRIGEMGGVLWFVSFFSLIDRRILTGFSAFLAFPSSQTELDVLFDILPVPRHIIDALPRSPDSAALFLVRHPNERAESFLAEACFVRLPRGAGLGVAQWPSVSVDLLYKEIPSGALYHYYARDRASPLRYHLYNGTPECRTVCLMCQLDNGPWKTNNIRLSEGERRDVPQLPRLSESSRERRGGHNAALHVRVIDKRDGLRTDLFEQSFEVTLLPWNTMRWAIPSDIVSGTSVDLSHHVAAFVTPDADAVVHLYEETREVAPGLDWSLGIRDSDDELLLEKVKAVYGVLQNKHLQYDDLPLPLGTNPTQSYQSIRLPRQTLEERCGNCVDVSVLLASVFERAQIGPLIVVEREHAFVGWRPIGPVPQEACFLDGIYLTAFCRTAPFDFTEALDSGRRLYREIEGNSWQTNKWFDPRGFARIVDIREHRWGKKMVLPFE